jgi:hypothetical protein
MTMMGDGQKYMKKIERLPSVTHDNSCKFYNRPDYLYESVDEKTKTPSKLNIESRENFDLNVNNSITKSDVSEDEINIIEEAQIQHAETVIEVTEDP